MTDSSCASATETKKSEKEHWVLKLGFSHLVAVLLIIAAVGNQMNHAAGLACVRDGFEKNVEPSDIKDLCSGNWLDIKVRNTNQPSTSSGSKE